MRKIIFGLLILSLAIWGAQGLALEQGSRPRNIILIGWDGVSRDKIKEFMARGELANLKDLSSKGALVAIDILRITDTRSGWAQILTGYEPETTGEYDNNSNVPIPKGYTVFERLKEFFGKTKIITAAVMYKKDNLGADPPMDEPVNKMPNGFSHKACERIFFKDGIEYCHISAKPYYYAQQETDFFYNGLFANDKVGSRAIEFLEKYKDKPFFLFLHFAETDKQGHAHGAESKEFHDALMAQDDWLGKIVQELKKLGAYEQTLVYVTADHGFDKNKTFHNDAPYVFLATNDPQVIRRGRREDITPTILDRFGLELNKISPALDGHPLDRPYEEPKW